MRGPAKTFPPGDFIREELEARQWTQADLAEVLGRPIRLVNELIGAKRSITPETAAGLAQAFGTSPELWMNLESAYQLGRAASAPSGVARRARIYSLVPVKELARRGWVEDSASIDVLEERICRFLGTRTVDEEPAFWAHAARKPTPYQAVTPAQRAWLIRARSLARSVSADGFSDRGLDAGLDRLRPLLTAPDEVRHVPRILADSGVRLVIVEALKGSRIDGACFWLDASSPVVALSIRFDRIDWFWFTLVHELRHVKNRDGLRNQNQPIDIDLVGDQTGLDGRPRYERDADREAAEFLIPSDQLASFITRVRPHYSTARLLDFARRVGVHPGIVVGQLQRRGQISYARNRAMLVKIREIITHSALTDGWGKTPQAHAQRN